MVARNQDDLVRLQDEVVEKHKVEKINLPGLNTLHTKPITDIAEVLTMVLKSRPNIIELRYKVGDCIELVTSSS